VPEDKQRRQNLNCNLARGSNRKSVAEQLEDVRRYDVAANEHDGLPLLDSMLLPPTQVAYVVVSPTKQNQKQTKSKPKTKKPVLQLAHLSSPCRRQSIALLSCGAISAMDGWMCSD